MGYAIISKYKYHGRVIIFYNQLNLGEKKLTKNYVTYYVYRLNSFVYFDKPKKLNLTFIKQINR